MDYQALLSKCTTNPLMGKLSQLSQSSNKVFSTTHVVYLAPVFGVSRRLRDPRKPGEKLLHKCIRSLSLRLLLCPRRAFHDCFYNRNG